MKKVVLFIGLLCLSSVANVFAGNSVSVKSGNVSVLKEQTKALFEIDYSATKVGSQMLDEYLQSRGDDFVKDWSKDRAKAAEYFTTRFNKKNKKGMQVTNDATAAYKFIIHVKTLDMGNGASGFMPYASAKAGGCIMSGTVEIVNSSTNEVLCTIEIDEVKGQGHPSETTRLGMMYFELATQICKLL